MAAASAAAVSAAVAAEAGKERRIYDTEDSYRRNNCNPGNFYYYSLQQICEAQGKG